MGLRQICFVSNDLENALRSFSFITGSDVCFRDEGVSYFGLKNGLLEVDGNFLEVVSPFKPNTTAERFLTRMNGDAGYMLIFECEDADSYRKKAVDLKIRDIWSSDLNNGVKATHYHPKDIGGLIISVDSMNNINWKNKDSYWQWSGDSWRSNKNNKCSIKSITMSCINPGSLAERWSSFLNLSLTNNDDRQCIKGDDFEIFFIEDQKKGIDYLSQLNLRVDNSALKKEILNKYKDNEIVICGTKIEIE